MNHKKYTFLTALSLAAALALAGCAQEQQTTPVEAEQATFQAVVLEVSENALLVQPAENSPESQSASQISISTGAIGEEASVEYLKTAQSGDTVSISYNGTIAESFPAQISHAYAISLVEKAPEQPAEEPALPKTIYVADAAQYRGELVEAGDSSWLVAQVPGRDYGFPSLTFTIDENTKTSTPWEEYAAGDYVEIYYSGMNENQEATAIGINKLGKADMVIYNGTLKEVRQGDKRTSLLIENMENPNQTTVFHISDSTQAFLDLNTLQPGDQLSILYNGIMARSLPPQATAQEISLYTAPQGE